MSTTFFILAAIAGFLMFVFATVALADMMDEDDFDWINRIKKPPVASSLWDKLFFPIPNSALKWRTHPATRRFMYAAFACLTATLVFSGLSIVSKIYFT